MIYSEAEQPEFDDEGFLINSAVWDSDIAEHIARMHGIDELNEVHWKIISSLRSFYLNNHYMPPNRQICHLNKLENNCVSHSFNNHGIEAWRIAGLPNPGEEIKSYM